MAVADLDIALTLWRQAIGASHVLDQPEQILPFERATFATARKILAVLEPSDAKEVAECLRVANHYKIPIYAVSTGKNWGNGSQLPWGEQGVLMRLNRLNRIIDFDEQLGIVTVEPGVTQKQLREFLVSQNSALALGLTGGAAESSVLGNVLERGDSRGLYGERSRFVGGMKVLLPNGSLLNCGQKISPDEVGPSLIGLFFQSNLGVVLEMTIWLEPKPALYHQVIFGVADDQKLSVVANQLQRLLHQNVLQNISLWNDYKTFSRLGQYREPLSQDARQQLRQKYGINPWMGNLAIYSQSPLHAQSQIELVTDALKPHTAQLHVLAGNASDADNLAMAYWRKNEPMPKNPDLDRDQCGLIWLMPLIPFRSEDVLAASQLIDTFCTKHGFEPNIALLGNQPRALKAIIGIVYDRKVEGEDRRAMACHDELLHGLIEQGYFPYRLGLQSAWAMEYRSKQAAELARGIKKLVDGNGIFALGRYE